MTIPDKVGDYIYVCTYPGHGQVMLGTLKVTTLSAPQQRPQAPHPKSKFLAAPSRVNGAGLPALAFTTESKR